MVHTLERNAALSVLSSVKFWAAVGEPWNFTRDVSGNRQGSWEKGKAIKGTSESS